MEDDPSDTLTNLMKMASSESLRGQPENLFDTTILNLSSFNMEYCISLR